VSSRTAANQNSRQARTTNSGSTRATASSEGWSASHVVATIALRRHAPSPCENSLPRLEDEAAAHPVSVAGAVAGVCAGAGEAEWMADNIMIQAIGCINKSVHELTDYPYSSVHPVTAA